MRRLALLTLLAGCGRFGFEDTPPEPDAAVDRCDRQPQADTVALYSFEGGLELDETTHHNARLVGAVEPTTAACGESGARFAGGYLLIPDSPAFDLEEGSIDLYVRTAASGALQGVLSRDANGTDLDGHFSIAIAANGQPWVRIQRMLNDLSVFRCGPPLVADAWTHLAVSFGPQGFRMWIDGVEPGPGLTVLAANDGLVSCDGPHAFGIAGNDNVWAVGGMIWTDTNGNPDPVPTSPLAGSLDQLRIRSTWRDFSAP